MMCKARDSVVVICDVYCVLFFFFKQKTAYEMRISDWSSDVCSSDLGQVGSVCDQLPLFQHRTRPTICCFEAGDGRRRLQFLHLQLWPWSLFHDVRSILQRCCRRRKVIGEIYVWKSLVSGMSVSVRVDLGGLRIIQNKTTTITT